MSLFVLAATAQQPGQSAPGGRNTRLNQYPATPGQSSATRPNATSTTGANAMNGEGVLRLSQILGSNVTSAQGKTLGQVRDVVVDPSNGRIDFAVLSLTGMTTPGASSITGTTTGRLVPVPWTLLRPGAMPGGVPGVRGGADMAGPHSFVLNVDETRLQTAPTIDANNWNQLQQNEFAQRAYSFFGVDWNRRGMTGAGTPGTGINTGTGTSRIPSTTTPGLGTPGSTTPNSGSGTGAGSTTPNPNPNPNPGGLTPTPGTGGGGTSGGAPPK